MEKINFDAESRYLPYAESIRRAFCGGLVAFLFFFLALPVGVMFMLPGLPVVAVSLFSQLGLGITTLAFLAGGRRLTEVLELDIWKYGYLKTGALWGVLTLLMVAGVQGLFFQLGEWCGFDMYAPSPIELLVRRMSWGGVAVLAVTAIFVAPVVEEIFFRRVIFSYLAYWCTWPPALIITAVAFALIHADLRQLPGLIVLGVGFQLMYLRSGSLYPSIIMHAVNNFIVMAIMLAAKYFQIGDL